MLVCLLSLAGCAGAPTRNPLPLELTNDAAIPGIPEARFWGDDRVASFDFLWIWGPIWPVCYDAVSAGRVL